MLSGVFLVGCSAEEKKQQQKELAELREMNRELERNASARDSLIDSFLETFNEVEDNLSRVERVEDTVLFSTKSDVELQGDPREQLIGRIRRIDALMKQNRQRIQTLKGRMKKADIKVDRLQEAIKNLEAALKEKNREIIALEDELARKDIVLKELYGEYQERLEDIEEQEVVLNEAFYAVGTYKELKEKKVLTREGGFIGLGGVEKLRDDPNKDYFTAIDLREKDRIELFGKRPEVATPHPEDSYRFEGESPVEYLLIKDPEAFWSMSKYLVVVVK